MIDLLQLRLVLSVLANGIWVICMRFSVRHKDTLGAHSVETSQVTSGGGHACSHTSNWNSPLQRWWTSDLEYLYCTDFTKSSVLSGCIDWTTTNMGKGKLFILVVWIYLENICTVFSSAAEVNFYGKWNQCSSSCTEENTDNVKNYCIISILSGR